MADGVERAATIDRREQEEFVCKVVRQSLTEPLGIEVKVVAAEPDTLFVGKVTQGLVNEWNQSNPETPLSSKCRISCVNGVRGRGAHLHDLLTSELLLNIGYERPRGCKFWQKG